MACNNTTNCNVPGHSEEDMVAYNALLGTLGGLAILTNAPLLIVLLKTNTPVFRSRMNYLVGNLALADCLTGCIVLARTAGFSGSFNLQIVWTTVEASFFTILVVSIERFIVLTYPLTWPLILSVRRTYACLVAIWLISVACGFAVEEYRFKAQFALTVVFEILICVTVALHGVIFFSLMKRHREFCDKYNEMPENRASNLNQVTQSSATKVIFILVVILIVTVLPYMLLMQIVMAHLLKLTTISDDTARYIDKWVGYLYPVEMINFIINPVVYAWRMERYRKAFRTTFSSMLSSLRPESTKVLLG